jgi:membrane protein implicated in regulation of membrane protease activity
MYLLLVGLSQVFLYFIFPPAVVIAMYCWIRRVHKKMKRSRGIQKVMETARKEMMTNITKQISLYLLAFWFTFVLGLIHNAYQIISGGGMLYNLLIVANCVYSLQGFVFMIVYFTLEKLGTKKVEECLPYDISDRENSTVNEIRTNVQRKIQHSSRRLFSRRDTVVYKSYVNVFDGAMRAENSTWAQFRGYYDDERSEQSDGVANENGWYNDEEDPGDVANEQKEDGDTTDISVDYPRRRSSLGSIISLVDFTDHPLPRRRRSM